MKILLTGASGFVGSSFMRRFADHPDLEILGLGRRTMDIAHYVQHNLTQPLDLPFKPDVVIHGAARAAPWGTRDEFVRQNVQATDNVVNFCVRNGHPKLIYISSSSVFYRHQHQFGMTEDSPMGPRFVNNYAATKHAGELQVRRYPGKYVIVRPRAVFGPGDTVLFPRILRAARLGQLPLFIQKGPAVRGDLIYIDNLCDYLLKAALDDRVVGDFNLTNAEPVAIQEFLSGILDRLGLRPSHRRVPVRVAMLAAGAVELAYRALPLRDEPPITRFGVSVFAYSKTFDVTKAIRLLGPPAVSLAEGTERFIHWQQEQL
jgi:2-alkyl-3-oxoalkanoate reductase